MKRGVGIKLTPRMNWKISPLYSGVILTVIKLNRDDE